ncbi:hypothetical protein A4A49_65805 [Nicotiana attenuata]|uniref:Uncharacterized protein n=1 Tax=Nicotiana attenuata TaxID=49451 RepID=A0A314KUP1_NICAT|nr:hypothetical protein A4A49_65805 [Nicotiana attenuata]
MLRDHGGSESEVNHIIRILESASRLILEKPLSTHHLMPRFAASVSARLARTFRVDFDIAGVWLGPHYLLDMSVRFEDSQKHVHKVDSQGLVRTGDTNRGIDVLPDVSGKVPSTEDMLSSFSSRFNTAATPFSTWRTKSGSSIISRQLISKCPPEAERPFEGNLFVPGHFVGKDYLFFLSDHRPSRGTGECTRCGVSPNWFV